MEKIVTIFDRDWEGHRGVVPRLLHAPGGATATEKLDGTNVRVTVRSGVAVRLEARQNPTKTQKEDGIKEPWYRDAGPVTDAWSLDALSNTDLSSVPDGEWGAEAVGPKIQGNPLDLPERRLYFFALDRIPLELCVPVLSGLPSLGPMGLRDEDDPEGAVHWFFEALREYMARARSKLNPDRGIEGIVWHGDAGFGGKLKVKDYK